MADDYFRRVLDGDAGHTGSTRLHRSQKIGIILLALSPVVFVSALYTSFSCMMADTGPCMDEAYRAAKDQTVLMISIAGSVLIALGLVLLLAAPALGALVARRRAREHK